MVRSRSILSHVAFLAGVALVAVLLRSFVFASFVIPTASMLPRLMVGDYLLVAKWPYGWSRHSLPFGLPPVGGRWRAALPQRGDVVVFKAPPLYHANYIKRVIGLPGDRVALRDGQVVLNGRTLPRLRVADLLMPISPNSPCSPEGAVAPSRERQPDGTLACRYRRFRETLPGGRAYDIIDLGDTQADDRKAVRVPAGHLFLLGDNRDRSADSRFPARDRGGIGLVPVDALVGRAQVTIFSTDGSARWAAPRSWWRAMRTDRIGTPLL